MTSAKGWLMLVIGLFAGTVAGGVGMALLHNYPKHITVERSYCVGCGTFTERSHEHVVLGGERSSRTWKGMFSSVAYAGPPSHEHQWVEPWAHVFPSDQGPAPGTQAHLKDSVLRMQMQELEAFDRTPHYVVVLHDAIQNDRAKAEAFIARMLDPKLHYTASTVELLRRDGSWEERWEAVDAFAKAHVCAETPEVVRCTLIVKGKPEVVYEMTAQGAGRRNMPSLRSWAPPEP